MNDLSPITDITKPDERNLYFVVTDAGGKARKLSLKDIYAEVSRIQLHEGVPAHIIEHFSQARYLSVYSWFHYPFNVTSQFMGFVSVEYALKTKSGTKKHFRALIREAVDKKWISDSGFTIAKHREGNHDKSYVETLVEVMPNLRNSLAHGSNMLHNNSISSLLICAEFINQLFEQPAG